MALATFSWATVASAGRPVWPGSVSVRGESTGASALT
jgi:hypothetical protein